MAIAFDKVTGLGNGTTGLSVLHTPIGTPRGALVLVVQDAGATDEVTSVTYGASAMSAVALSPNLHTTGLEDGVLYGYFLGSSVPTGAQTVTVNVNGTGSTKVGWVATVTAAADTSVEDTSILDSGGVANPSVVLDIASDSWIAAIIHSGQGTTGSVTEGTDYTNQSKFDFGAAVAQMVYRTNIATAGAITVDWTVASEEAGILAVAIKEGVSSGTTVTATLSDSFTFGELLDQAGQFEHEYDSDVVEFEDLLTYDVEQFFEPGTDDGSGQRSGRYWRERRLHRTVRPWTERP